MSVAKISGLGASTLLVLVSLFGGVHSPAVVVAQEVEDPTAPGDKGEVQVGEPVSGELAGLSDEDVFSYHTYTVEVPEGTEQLVVEMVATEDLDLAIKHGEPILEYGTDPDWDYADIELESSAVLMVDNPEQGTWFIDVINTLPSTDAVPYTLAVE